MYSSKESSVIKFWHTLMNFFVTIMGGSIMKTLRTYRLIAQQAKSIFEFYLVWKMSAWKVDLLLMQLSCSSFIWLNFNRQVLCQHAWCLMNVASMSSPLPISIPIGICPRDCNCMKCSANDL